MTQSNYGAYQRTQKLAITPSAAEAASLIRAAGLLEKAKNTLEGAANDRDAYAAALQFNQRFWTILQADLASGANALPEDLRNDLLSLSVFVDKQTIKALAERRPEHLDALIAINRNVAQGLRDQQG